MQKIIKCDKIKEFSKDYRPTLVVSGDIQNQFDDFMTGGSHDDNGKIRKYSVVRNLY
ncbi:MAG: hypothetical protein NY202_03155 [Mollicutes bacterium UO1]